MCLIKFNKKNELNIMVDDIKPHIMIGITESWTNNELALTGCVMFRKDRVGRRGEGVLYWNGQLGWTPALGLYL